jgi:hypothetical protein
MRDSPSNNFKPFDCGFDKAKTVPIERSKFSQVIPEECSAENRASGKVCNQLLLTDKKLPLPISRILHTRLASFRLGCSDPSFVVRGLSPERRYLSDPHPSHDQDLGLKTSRLCPEKKSWPHRAGFFIQVFRPVFSSFRFVIFLSLSPSFW